jgi:hypothetical protein
MNVYIVTTHTGHLSSVGVLDLFSAGVTARRSAHHALAEAAARHGPDGVVGQAELAHLRAKYKGRDELAKPNFLLACFNLD